MKINQDIRSSLEKRGQDSRVAGPGTKNFHSMIQKQETQLGLAQLTRLIADIETAGSRVAKSRNFQDLAKFKGLVKRFVHEAVEFGMDTKQTSSWDYNGHTRSLTIVQQIDRELISLTESILGKESDSVDILAKIGEIKGLLINLYT
ncbi:DUF327 family protein [Bacillus lacus]|uniref:DUF327 family protein n=1 Tax=Metabacillus lacus TaxID=1983721 RepID=A0A7X2M0J7_9BACI|nr:YaaR family protein [Metabacillus lacus]MRX72934.1 DUF327 family protein [Metabacillus lacus]